MIKYRVLKVVKRGHERFYPQERIVLFWGMIKYWSNIVDVYWSDTYFLNEQKAQEFIKNIHLLKVNYKKVYDAWKS